MTDEQEALVIANLGLARKVSIRFINFLGYDEAYSEACLGLIKAALTWDGQGSFTGWASVRVNGELKDEVRRRTPGSRYWRDKDPEYKVSVNSLNVLVENGWNNDPEDTDRLPEEQCEINDIKRRVFSAIEKLVDERQVTIIKDQYFEDLPLVEIAKKLGLDPKAGRVSQIRSKAYEKLREALADFDPKVIT